MVTSPQGDGRRAGGGGVPAGAAGGRPAGRRGHPADGEGAEEAAGEAAPRRGALEAARARHRRPERSGGGMMVSMGVSLSGPPAPLTVPEELAVALQG